jgi:radical SAM protein with 4Fe4S-binding SPASM domain
LDTTVQELRTCGAIDQNNIVTQYFRAPDDHLSGVSLRFGTYRKVMTHRLRFRIDLIDEADIGRTAATPERSHFCTEITAEGISDGGWFQLYFPTIEHSKEQLFVLEISSPDAAPGNAVTAWMSRAADRIAGHVVCLAGRSIEGGFGLQARLTASNPVATTSYPQGMLYSPYSSCNMNCTHCISRHTRERAVHMSDRMKQDIKAHVDTKQLRWMFTDYSGDIFFAEHSNPGELDFILGLGIAIHIDTNGAYLTAEYIERIMRSAVDTLSISVDAAQDETYHAIRRGAPPIERIFQIAKAVVEARARHGRKRNFRIFLGYTLMRSNLHELPLFIQEAARAGIDAVGCRHIEVYHADMESESLFHHKKYFNSMRAACIELAKSLGIRLNIGEELHDYPTFRGRTPCNLPWSSATVLANGDVLACCVPGSKMGNTNEQSLESIWQGEAYRRLRARVNSVNPPSLCKQCPFRSSLNDYASPAALRANLTARPLLDDLMAHEISVSA